MAPSLISLMVSVDVEHHVYFARYVEVGEGGNILLQCVGVWMVGEGGGVEERLYNNPSITNVLPQHTSV